MILVDTNVLMYAAGAEHRFKRPSADLLDRVASGDVEAAVDAEILQEILHRYRLADRWKDGKRLYELSRAVFPVVLPVTDAVMDASVALLDRYRRLTARDAVHLAACRVFEVPSICSYDRDLDGIEGIARVEPARAR
jgi:hypothetical protein